LISALQEVNYYIVKLSPASDMAVDLIINLARKNAMEKKELEELIQFQQIEEQANLKLETAKYPYEKKRLAQEKWEKLFPVYSAIHFWI